MRLTIYSKPGCHLCEDMKALVTRVVGARSDISIETIDISTDPALMKLYELEIPVLMIDGKKAAKFRVSEPELRRRLNARQHEVLMDEVEAWLRGQA